MIGDSLGQVTLLWIQRFSGYPLLILGLAVFDYALPQALTTPGKFKTLYLQKLGYSYLNHMSC